MHSIVEVMAIAAIEKEGAVCVDGLVGYDGIEGHKYNKGIILNT